MNKSISPGPGFTAYHAVNLFWSYVVTRAKWEPGEKTKQRNWMLEASMVLNLLSFFVVGFLVETAGDDKGSLDDLRGTITEEDAEEDPQRRPSSKRSSKRTSTSSPKSEKAALLRDAGETFDNGVDEDSSPDSDDESPTSNLSSWASPTRLWGILMGILAGSFGCGNAIPFFYWKEDKMVLSQKYHSSFLFTLSQCYGVFSTATLIMIVYVVPKFIRWRIRLRAAEKAARVGRWLVVSIDRDIW